MSRLTKRISVENEDVIFYTKGEYYNTTAGEMRSSNVREVMRKLAEYEDLEEMLGIPFEQMVELCKEHVPDGAKYPKRVKVLTDESVDEWEQYKQDKEQGLLLKLPCKVRSTVYLVDPRFATSRRKVMECYIDEYTVNKYGCYAVLSGNEPFYMFKRFTAVNITDFGKTVFLTKEEAEKELKRLECAE